jgi:hypothetical protein
MSVYSVLNDANRKMTKSMTKSMNVCMELNLLRLFEK